MNCRENMEAIFRHEQPEWIPHLRHDNYVIFDSIVERPLFETGRDAWTCNWISCPDSLNITHPDTSDYKFEDIEDWREKVEFPDIDSIDFTPLIQQAETFTHRDEMLIEYISLNGIFERTHILMGFEAALCAAMIDPEEYGKLLSAIADHKIRLFEKIYSICSPELLVYHDDMAAQGGQFFQTEIYEKYLFPQYKRIVAAARKIGYKYVVHHSCGRIEKLIPSWLSCGFDGWDSVMACNNLAQIKKDYGDKIVFMPGMDTQGVLGQDTSTRSDIEHMVVDWMEMLAGDGTGLILDSSVSYSLNPKNEEISLEFILKHGKPFMDAKRAGVDYVPEYEMAEVCV